MGQAMAPGSSPSVIASPSKLYEATYRGANRSLWVAQLPAPGTATNLALPIQSGTNPAIG